MSNKKISHSVSNSFASKGLQQVNHKAVTEMAVRAAVAMAIEKTERRVIMETQTVFRALLSVSLNASEGFGAARINRVLDRINLQLECLNAGELTGEDLYRWCQEKGVKLSYSLGGTDNVQDN